MLTGSGETKSIWTQTAEVPVYPPLRENTEADVCVVGAGIAGMMTAYQLAKAGRRVIVLDDGGIGSGETGRTTAHITAALDDRYYEIERVHGEEGARLAAQSHMTAINRSEEICRLEQIDCDHRRIDGYLFLAPGYDRTELEKELQAAQRAGIADTEIVQRAPFEWWDTGPCLKFPAQAQFHVLKFLAGIACCLERDGARIYCGTHVSDVQDGEPARVHTASGATVTARAVVAATNASISDYVVTHMKQAPYRTYVIGVRVAKAAVPYGLYWDSGWPYHYVRLQAGETHDVLIVGGEDHKTGHKDDGAERFRTLEAWTRSHFPMAQDVAYRWSGQVMEPYDYMAFTGRSPGEQNVYLHSGDSGNGITHGFIAGILLSDLILGRENSWAGLYDPRRISLRAAPEFIKENVDVMLQYTHYVLPGESLQGLQPGEGRVVQHEGKRIAVYRDQAGVVHQHSAVCTHMKCIVQWNSLEKSWDCPCHGSRFDPYGHVLNGPAIEGLKPVGDPAGVAGKGT